MLIVCLYVDYLIFNSDYNAEELKLVMESEFEMTNFGLMRYFMGIQSHQTEDGIFISQSK